MCEFARMSEHREGARPGEQSLNPAPEPSTGLGRRAFVTGGLAGALALPLLDPAAALARTVGSPRLRAAHRRSHRPRRARVHASAPFPGGLPDPGTVYARHSNPADLSVLEAASLLQAGMLSSQELTAACQARIARRNGPVSFAGTPDTINAWIRLYPQTAADLSQAADARLAQARRAGTRAPSLCGVPIALKDLFAASGLPLTASSRVLDGNVARGDSTVWARLRDVGMVLLGHTGEASGPVRTLLTPTSPPRPVGRTCAARPGPTPRRSVGVKLRSQRASLRPRVRV